MRSRAAILLPPSANSSPKRWTSRPPPSRSKLSQREKLEESISRYALAYDIPESLIHAAVRRESNYNPAAKNGPYWGLMQIRYDTARSVGYSGPAKGLLDAETNLTYAGAYLANAFRVAGGDAQRAIQLYAKGFYYEAKRKGLLGQMASGRSSTEEEKSEPTLACRSGVAGHRAGRDRYSRRQASQNGGAGSPSGAGHDVYGGAGPDRAGGADGAAVEAPVKKRPASGALRGRGAIS